MNIFAVDLDPVIAAQSLIDRHVVKMPSECCIMLANAYPIERLRQAPRTQNLKLRGHAYPHHGCTRWVKLSYQNFEWLVQHSIALCEEYTYRTGKVHFCQTFIEWARQNNPILPILGLTPHFLAVGEQYKIGGVVESYRAYYCGAKKVDKRGKPMYEWTRRQKPAWA